MIIIGAGRVGGALASAAIEHGVRTTLVDRASGWQALQTGSGPILVTTRNDDLPEIVGRVPSHRHADLVFVQNGMLRDWLREAGLSNCTRGLLFFAVAERGAPIEAGESSPFTGRHAAALVEFLTRLQVPARVVQPREFALVELEKLAWNTAFGLLCERFDVAVGAVVEQHSDLMNELLEELVTVGEVALQLRLTEPERRQLLQGIVNYSRSIPGYRGAVKEWRWRNGWFVESALTLGIATPVHHALLSATGHG